ncbi:MAG: IS256 family transposase, partial [Candidatus Eisenbacteria bacterium]|nr:IS256 family transposase [Candidatus Eisenbacteria bacterium]
MTRQEHSTALDHVVELVAQHGTEAIATAFATLLETGMKLEREQVLGAAAYERSERRRGYANGYKPKTLDTRAGRITVQVPKTRGIEFYPAALEKGVRSERALKAAIAEMYVKGVSTRRVTDVMRELCGLDVSSTQVSRAAKELDEDLEAWRTREIGPVTYLILDARYEKVRHGGTVVDCAILTAIGVRPDGRRTILGTSCSLSEAEVHWRAFLESLIERGMHGVRLIVSDDHAGIRAARNALFPGVPWQRCQFHLAQNAMAYVPRMSMRREVGEDIRTIFNAADREETERRLARAVEKYRESAPKLAAWMEENLPEGFTVLAFPRPHRRRLRTTNGLERIHKEIKRRTRVAA